jgi:hypothetical protein
MADDRGVALPSAVQRFKVAARDARAGSVTGKEPARVPSVGRSPGRAKALSIVSSSKKVSLRATVLPGLRSRASVDSTHAFLANGAHDEIAILQKGVWCKHRILSFYHIARPSAQKTVARPLVHLSLIRMINSQ